MTDSGAQVSTRSGDDGYTSLLGPGRVPKYSPRPNAFGTLDEASAALGMARATCSDEKVRPLIHEFQLGLYKLMAELATPAEQYEKVPFKMKSEDVERLNEISTELKQHVVIGKVFVIPGATQCGATLDLARTIVRRGERLVAELTHQGELTNPHVIEWLNRLSDCVFILARFVERDVDAVAE